MIRAPAHHRSFRKYSETEFSFSSEGFEVTISSRKLYLGIQDNIHLGIRLSPSFG